MVGNLRVTEQRGPLSSAGLRRFWVGAGAALLAAALIGSAAPRVAAGEETGGVHQVLGGGKTIIEGGTGAPAYIPVTTATLVISGMTFHEILLEGQVTIH